MTPAFHELKTITEKLLTPQMDYSGNRQAAIALHELFCEKINFDINESCNQPHIHTESGLAVGPMSAAFCIIDFVRTRTFLLAIRDAIKEKLKMNPGRPVIVLYAGTGPFATLLVPLITEFSPDQLQLVLMEINPVSYNYLEKTIQQFGMTHHILDTVLADAFTYCIPEKHKPDIIVSETMKPGLQKEPQVNIVAHLISQCDPGTILIPELVKVDVCLAGNLGKDPGAIIFLKTLFEFDSQTARQIKSGPGTVPVLAEGVVVEIKKAEENYGRLALTTAVKIFNEHWLRFNESSLSVRHVMMKMADIKKFPARLLFQYKMGTRPGFVVTELEC